VSAISRACPDVQGRTCLAPETCDTFGCAAYKRTIALGHVEDERKRQDAQWGGIPGLERRDDHTYAAVLTEEVGEVCKAWLERDTAALREELVQVAAVAVAWIEELDNGGAQPRA
jgi:NTP pyrophosphatase (non-canonical NTP hydrolase)